MPSFPDVSLLVTHYNRSKSLEHLLRTMSSIDCHLGEIIVSDDGSKAEHLEYLNELKEKFGFTLVTTEKNRGLGNNINKGHKAATKNYVLYVQEDFEPQPGFPDKLTKAMGYMDKDSSLDLVRFYAYFPHPYMKKYDDDFSIIDIPRWAMNYDKIHCYSDHPHLKRKTFPDKFGPYAEGIKGDRTEYKMCISFLRNKGKALFYNNFKELFFQKNSAAEPSTMQREDWRQSDNIFIRPVRYIYRQLRYNYDILFGK